MSGFDVDEFELMTWEGKQIDVLTREEAIEALRRLGREYFQLTTPGAIRARALGSVEMVKRGETSYG